MSSDIQTRETVLNTPILTIIRGIPGGGKSYIATKIQEIIGAEKIVIVDPDAIDKDSKEYTDLSQGLTTEGVDPKFHVYRYLRSKAYDGILNHKIIIWNQAFIDFSGLEKTILRLQTFASEHRLELPVLIVEVEVDEAVARERLNNRRKQGGHEVNEDAFTHFTSNYKSFFGMGYDTITLNGENDVSASAESVIKRLERL